VPPSGYGGRLCLQLKGKIAQQHKSVATTNGCALFFCLSQTDSGFQLDFFASTKLHGASNSAFCALQSCMELSMRLFGLYKAAWGFQVNFFASAKLHGASNSTFFAQYFFFEPPTRLFCLYKTAWSFLLDFFGFAKLHGACTITARYGKVASVGGSLSGAAGAGGKLRLFTRQQ